ncbi:MAG: GYDIA family GHMP kinase, partial [Bergeyella zoohelcum]|nr:GYDIA family GHMP kinase [Bergeyella zoohelcum]
MNSIFSHGKLLLTSEYVVLDGALALAVPTRLGQEFSFTEIDDAQSVVLWEAYHQGSLWLSAKIDYQTWEILETNIPQSADFILKVLKNVQQLSSNKFQQNQSYYLKTNLQFPADFGLGSSSTLMNNLAEWSGVDAYLLNDYSLGGSGYDIAVAKAKQPILFQIKENERRAEIVDFSPEFAEDLLFVHLNQKQDSREGISLYRSKEKPQNLVDFFSEITTKILE